jgi:hypothetical protein
MTLAPMNFSRSPLTDTSIAIFAATSPGAVLASAAVEKECAARLGVRVLTKEWRGRMGTAKKALLEEHSIRIRFSQEHGGWWHVTDDSMPDDGDRDKRAIRRTIKRAFRSQLYGYKQPENLPPELKARRDANLAGYRTLHEFAAPAARRLHRPKVANNAQIAAGVVPFKKKV